MKFPVNIHCSGKKKQEGSVLYGVPSFQLESIGHWLNILTAVPRRFLQKFNTERAEETDTCKNACSVKKHWNCVEKYVFFVSMWDT